MFKRLFSYPHVKRLTALVSLTFLLSRIFYHVGSLQERETLVIKIFGKEA